MISAHGVVDFEVLGGFQSCKFCVSALLVTEVSEGGRHGIYLNKDKKSQM